MDPLPFFGSSYENSGYGDGMADYQYAAYQAQQQDDQPLSAEEWKRPHDLYHRQRQHDFEHPSELSHEPAGPAGFDVGDPSEYGGMPSPMEQQQMIIQQHQQQQMMMLMMACSQQQQYYPIDNGHGSSHNGAFNGGPRGRQHETRPPPSHPVAGPSTLPASQDPVKITLDKKVPTSPRKVPRSALNGSHPLRPSIKPRPPPPHPQPVHPKPQHDSLNVDEPVASSFNLKGHSTHRVLVSDPGHPSLTPIADNLAAYDLPRSQSKSNASDALYRSPSEVAEIETSSLVCELVAWAGRVSSPEAGLDAVLRQVDQAALPHPKAVELVREFVDTGARLDWSDEPVVDRAMRATARKVRLSPLAIKVVFERWRSARFCIGGDGSLRRRRHVDRAQEVGAGMGAEAAMPDASVREREVVGRLGSAETETKKAKRALTDLVKAKLMEKRRKLGIDVDAVSGESPPPPTPGPAAPAITQPRVPPQPKEKEKGSLSDPIAVLSDDEEMEVEALLDHDLEDEDASMEDAPAVRPPPQEPLVVVDQVMPVAIKPKPDEDRKDPSEVKLSLNEKIRARLELLKNKSQSPQPDSPVVPVSEALDAPVQANAPGPVAAATMMGGSTSSFAQKSPRPSAAILSLEPPPTGTSIAPLGPAVSPSPIAAEAPKLAAPVNLPPPPPAGPPPDIPPPPPSITSPSPTSPSLPAPAPPRPPPPPPPRPAPLHSSSSQPNPRSSSEITSRPTIKVERKDPPPPNHLPVPAPPKRVVYKPDLGTSSTFSIPSRRQQIAASIPPSGPSSTATRPLRRSPAPTVPLASSAPPPPPTMMTTRSTPTSPRAGRRSAPTSPRAGRLPAAPFSPSTLASATATASTFRSPAVAFAAVSSAPTAPAPPLATVLNHGPDRAAAAAAGVAKRAAKEEARQQAKKQPAPADVPARSTEAGVSGRDDQTVAEKSGGERRDEENVLPPGWVAKLSKTTQRTWYYHAGRKESSWVWPTK